jgi:hypothetical protein
LTVLARINVAIRFNRGWKAAPTGKNERKAFLTSQVGLIPFIAVSALPWGDENSHIGALNFYPSFIPLFERKVSGVSVQDMVLRLPFLTPETRHLKPNSQNKTVSKVNSMCTKLQMNFHHLSPTPNANPLIPSGSSRIRAQILFC